MPDSLVTLTLWALRLVGFGPSESVAIENVSWRSLSAGVTSCGPKGDVLAITSDGSTRNMPATSLRSSSSSERPQTDKVGRPSRRVVL